jgi:hypothetical protein
MSSLSEHLEQQSVRVVESTIPEELTIDEWRAARKRRGATCDHLHDTTSRYDVAQKQLTFLLVCPICHTERVVDQLHYEPNFRPLQAVRSTHVEPAPAIPATDVDVERRAA